MAARLSPGRLPGYARLTSGSGVEDRQARGRQFTGLRVRGVKGALEPVVGLSPFPFGRRDLPRYAATIAASAGSRDTGGGGAAASPVCGEDAEDDGMPGEPGTPVSSPVDTAAAKTDSGAVTSRTAAPGPLAVQTHMPGR
ncbi:hypothetical protein [Streptomyces sp. NPDC012616]|uniref:hypothetical protein n=1 Tax=Streptomyces sp. NPDC012616 TaxID=3364840 RepID=UPI0036E08CDA